MLKMADSNQLQQVRCRQIILQLLWPPFTKAFSHCWSSHTTVLVNTEKMLKMLKTAKDA